MNAYEPKTPEEPVLLAVGLVKQFAGRRVVDGVGLSCQAGQVLGVLGANGAGKTTTLRMCYGFLQPDAGTIRIAGTDRRADPETASRRVGVCTQDDTFDNDFTVRGNLAVSYTHLDVYKRQGRQRRREFRGRALPQVRVDRSQRAGGARFGPVGRGRR